MRKFFYDQKKAFSIRKLTVGIVSLCIGSSLLIGQDIVAAQQGTVTGPRQLRFEYVLESELTAEERKLLQSSLPDSIQAEATYFLVYRPSKSSLPQTGELLSGGMACLGAGFLILAIVATRSKKTRVLTMLYVTTAGLLLPLAKVEAARSHALAAYNQTYTIQPGETLPSGKINLAGYDFVGYLVKEMPEVASQSSKPEDQTQPTQDSTVDQAQEASQPMDQGQANQGAPNEVPIHQPTQEAPSVPSEPAVQPDQSVPVAPPVEPAPSVPSEPAVQPDQSVPAAPPVEPAQSVPSAPTAQPAQSESITPPTLAEVESPVEDHQVIPEPPTTAVSDQAPTGPVLPELAFEVRERVEETSLPIPVQEVETDQLPAGQVRTEEGQAGRLQVRYEEVLVAGQVVGRREVSREETPSTPSIRYIGTGQVAEPETETEPDSDSSNSQPVATPEPLVTDIPDQAPTGPVLPELAFEVRERVEETSLPIPVQEVETDQLPAGQVRTEEGQAGRLQVRYEEVLVAGQVVGRREVSREETPSTPSIRYIGTGQVAEPETEPNQPPTEVETPPTSEDQEIVEAAKPTMTIRNLAINNEARTATVHYLLEDTGGRYEGAQAHLFANEQIVASAPVTRRDNDYIATFTNLQANTDYLVRTELTYANGDESLVDSLADEAALDIEERRLEIKNIDQVELWKFENGKASIQRQLTTRPTDLSPYFARVLSAQQKEILLPITQIDLVVEEGQERFKLKASLDNLVEMRNSQSSYSEGISFYVAKQAAPATSVYVDFNQLIADMEARPWDTFTLGADLTASAIDSSGKRSYVSATFTGRLNGAGYTIYDLALPLFHRTSGEIDNLHLVDVAIHQSSQEEVGALAKEARGGRIERVRVEGRITGANSVGGLLGIAYNTEILNTKVQGRVSTQSTGLSDNYLGGLVGWLGQNGRVRGAYTDVLLSTNSNRSRVGGIVGQMDSPDSYVRQAFATGSISAPKTDNSDLGGIVGTIIGTNNSLIEDVISAVSVPNGRKVYHFVTQPEIQLGEVYVVENEASGQDNAGQIVLTADQARERLAGYQISGPDVRQGEDFQVLNRQDVPYQAHPHYHPSKQLAYENMEKLLPYFTRDVIIQQANRLEATDLLVTKRLVDAIPLDGYNGDRPIFDSYGRREWINRLLLHFEDGTIRKEWLLKKQDLNNGTLVEYHILDKNITYTPENMVALPHLDSLMNRLLPEFEAVNYNSPAFLEALGLTSSPNDYATKELLFLRESFAKVKANIRQHLRDLLVTDRLIGLTSQTIEEYTFDYIQKHKTQLLIGLAYMDRWYAVHYGDMNAKELMTKRADFFGQSVSSLDTLITLGSLGAGALKPSNNYALGSQLIAKPAVQGDLFAYLEAYRKRFAPDQTDSSWFNQTSKATIIETNSTVEAVRNRQENPNDKTYSNHFYDKLKSKDWPFKEMALILLTMPSNDIFILTDMANTLIGSYDNQTGSKEEIDVKLHETAIAWARHADYLYRILPEEHKEKMFRQMITWDTKKINGSWYEVDSLSSLSQPSFKHFYMPLGYKYDYSPVGANSDLKNIFYFNHEAISQHGTAIYTHELTHVADDDTFLLGHGRRAGMDFETYARGLFESINWHDQDILGVNSIFDFSNYEATSYGRRLTNLSPERFQSTQDLETYMRGYFDVIYSLDYLEAEAVFALGGTLNFQSARRNWFDKMTTLDDNETLVERFRRAGDLTSIDQLIDNGLVSRRSYDPPGHGENDLHLRNSYLMINSLNPIYGSLNNNGYSRNEFEFRKLAFELLAEKGYEEGFVPYLSNQYQADLGQTDPAGRIADDQLIATITDGRYSTAAAFRKAMFDQRRMKLDQLKSIRILGANEGQGYFYGDSRTLASVADIRQLMREAVEYDANQETYHAQHTGYEKTRSRVYRLKAAILNAYLRETREFRDSIYNQ